MTWIAVSAAVIVALCAGLWVWGRRRRKPVDKLAAARKAAGQIRRERKRPGDDIFRRGWGVPDRHTGAVGENDHFRAAAGFDGDSGGGGGSD
jgi:hypothetical protein